MPWRKLAQSPSMKIYKETLGDMIKGNTDVDITIMGMLVRTEILKHNFTKRQINIITLVYTFSFAYGKKAAYIPDHAKFFEIAGVSHKKIKHEMDKLLKMNIITWDKEENLISFNEPRLWNAPLNNGYNEDYLRQLFMMNLDHFGVDVSPIIEKINKIKNN